jgi:hypothetical protein
VALELPKRGANVRDGLVALIVVVLSLGVLGLVNNTLL